MLVQTILLVIAAILSAGIALAYVFSSGSSGERSQRAGALALIGVPVVFIAVLSALHARGTLDLGWLFSGEETDAGPIEYGTVLFFLLASGVSVLIARADQSWIRFAYLGLAAACFFIAGEELSWGQWIFHWDTPEALSEVNLQNETNLHNLVNPRLYDPIYSLVGFLLIAMSAVSVIGHLRRVLTTQAGQPVMAEIFQFVEWQSAARFALAFTLSTGILLQHESFEEYSELVLSATLFLFLMFRLHAVSVGRSDMAPAE